MKNPAAVALGTLGGSAKSAGGGAVPAPSSVHELLKEWRRPPFGAVPRAEQIRCAARLECANELAVALVGHEPVPQAQGEPPICSGCQTPMQRVEWRCGMCGTYRDAAAAGGDRLPSPGDPLREWLTQFVIREGLLMAAKGKGGQSVGRSPSITPSVLKELERILRDSSLLKAEPEAGTRPAPDAATEVRPGVWVANRCTSVFGAGECVVESYLNCVCSRGTFRCRVQHPERPQPQEDK